MFWSFRKTIHAGSGLASRRSTYYVCACSVNGVRHPRLLSMFITSLVIHIESSCCILLRIRGSAVCGSVCRRRLRFLFSSIFLFFLSSLFVLKHTHIKICRSWPTLALLEDLSLSLLETDKGGPTEKQTAHPHNQPSILRASHSTDGPFFGLLTPPTQKYEGGMSHQFFCLFFLWCSNEPCFSKERQVTIAGHLPSKAEHAGHCDDSPPWPGKISISIHMYETTFHEAGTKYIYQPATGATHIILIASPVVRCSDQQR